MILPYDYIESNDGWIYVVRCIVSDGGFLAKPIYSPVYSGRIKHKILLKIDYLPMQKAWINYPPDVFHFYKDEVTQHWPVAANTIKFDNFTADFFRSVVSIIKKIDPLATCSITGSRRVGTHRTNSDHDLLICTNLHPLIIKENILASNSQWREFNESEIRDRINRYSPNSCISNQLIKDIFYAGTLYLKSKLTGNELGLFFISKETSNYIIPAIYSSSHVDLIGEILPSNGSSFHMPRIFYIKDNQCKIIELVTIIWEACGIELLSGRRVKLTDCLMIGDNRYLFGGPHSRLE